MTDLTSLKEAKGLKFCHLNIRSIVSKGQRILAAKIIGTILYLIGTLLVQVVATDKVHSVRVITILYLKIRYNF